MITVSRQSRDVLACPMGYHTRLANYVHAAISGDPPILHQIPLPRNTATKQRRITHRRLRLYRTGHEGNLSYRT